MGVLSVSQLSAGVPHLAVSSIRDLLQQQFCCDTTASKFQVRPAQVTGLAPEMSLQDARVNSVTYFPPKRGWR